MVGTLRPSVRSASDCAERAIGKTTGMNLKGNLGLVNSPDSPSRNNQKLGNLFSPRLGIAYRLNEQDRYPHRVWDLLSA